MALPIYKLLVSKILPATPLDAKILTPVCRHFSDSNRSWGGGCRLANRLIADYVNGLSNRGCAVAVMTARQYDETHGLFRDDFPFSFGLGHFWAQEVAGNRSSDWQGAERVSPRLERI